VAVNSPLRQSQENGRGRETPEKTDSTRYHGRPGFIWDSQPKDVGCRGIEAAVPQRKEAKPKKGEGGPTSFMAIIYPRNPKGRSGSEPNIPVIPCQKKETKGDFHALISTDR